MLAEAAKNRADYLSKKAELLKGLQGADAQAREQIRAQLKDAREQFLAQQRDLRSDLRKTIEQLKDRLPDHGDVIDHAKDQAKGAAKSRKDGTD